MQTPSANLEHCFARDYTQARAAFVQAALDAGARHWQVAHPELGLQGEALGMDFAWLGPTSAQRVLVSLSGTHGIEGFAGSACQRAWLSTSAPGHLPPDTAVLMVHAVNPWGFSWLRRVDAQNIDVNRNALSSWQMPPANPDYAQFHALLMQHAPARAEAEHGFVQALQAWMAQLGVQRATRAITGGQYTHPQGLFFGGQAPSWSVRHLSAQVQAVLAQARAIAVLDHHTGLGPRGHTEIICRHPAGSEALALARQWWGQDTTATELGESSSEVLDGNVRMAFANWCPQALVVAVALEVGTLPGQQVLQALVADHVVHQFGQPRSVAGEAVRERMRLAFDPPDAAWRERCVSRSLALYSATLSGLSELPHVAGER